MLASQECLFSRDQGRVKGKESTHPRSKLCAVLCGEFVMMMMYPQTRLGWDSGNKEPTACERRYTESWNQSRRLATFQNSAGAVATRNRDSLRYSLAHFLPEENGNCHGARTFHAERTVFSSFLFPFLFAARNCLRYMSQHRDLSPPRQMDKESSDNQYCETESTTSPKKEEKERRETGNRCCNA